MRLTSSTNKKELNNNIHEMVEKESQTQSILQQIKHPMEQLDYTRHNSINHELKNVERTDRNIFSSNEEHSDTSFVS